MFYHRVMATSKLRSGDQERRRQSIREATRTVIAEGGIEAATVRSIAAEAGQSVATLYNLMGSRSEILAAVFDDLSTELHTVMTLDDGLGPVEQLRRSMKTAVAYMVKRKQVFAPIIVELSPDLGGGESARSSFDQSVALQRAIIGRAIEEGVLLGDLEPDLLARAVVRAFIETQQRWAAGHLSNPRFLTAALQGSALVWLSVASGDSRPQLLEIIQPK